MRYLAQARTVGGRLVRGLDDCDCGAAVARGDRGLPSIFDGGDEFGERRTGIVWKCDALAFAAGAEQCQWRPRVEMQGSVGADDRELMVGARARLPTGMDGAGRA